MQQIKNRKSSREKKVNWCEKIDTNWIKKGIDREAVGFSENFGKHIAHSKMSTSQIRNVYGELKRIQMKGYQKEKTAFLLLLPKMAYSAKRNNCEGLKDFKEVFNVLHSKVENEHDFENLMNLMEAILAYHKANGGK